MTTAIVRQTVNFYGDNLAIVERNGLAYTPVKPICEALKIDWEGQRQRIERDEILSTCACMIQVQLPGNQRREMVCLPLDFLNGWLFGVDTNRVQEENRANLLRYKLECYRVLRDAFQGTAQSIVGATVDEMTNLYQRLDAMTEELHEMKCIVRTRVKGRKRPELPALPSPRRDAVIARRQRILDVISAHGGEAGFMVIGRELYEQMGGKEKALLHRDLTHLRTSGAVRQSELGAPYAITNEAQLCD